MGERAKRQIGALVNDSSSGIINTIVGGTEGLMSRRGKKRGRTESENNMEVMQVTKHTS